MKKVALFFLVSLLFMVNTSVAGVIITPNNQWLGLSIKICPVYDGYTISILNPNNLENVRTISFIEKTEGTVFVTWATVQDVNVICKGTEIEITAYTPAKIVLSDEMLPRD